MDRDPARAHPDKTLYDMLQVSPTASSEVIHAAYRALARGNHPDVNPSVTAAQRMLHLNAAYDVLGDAQRRARYDLSLLRASRPVARATHASATAAGNLRRGRAGRNAPKRIEDQRAMAGDGRGVWSAGRPRALVVLAVAIVLAVALGLAMWLTSEFLDYTPDGVTFEEMAKETPASRGVALQPPAEDGSHLARPFLNRR
jgi:curved DNA-binding protein CbpA